VGETCSRDGDEKCIQNFSLNSSMRILLGRSSHRCEHNIKRWCLNMEWIQLVQLGFCGWLL
jgi:hypothetical protein